MAPSVLFINRVYPPVRGATGRCLADLAVRLAGYGWRVTVLTCGYAEEGPAEGGVTVVRAGGPSGSGAPPGAAGYAGALARLLARGLALPRHDVVVTLTDPPLLAVAGTILAGRFGAAAVHWAHDLYPDLLPVVGVRLPAPVQAGLKALSMRALRRHDAVVAIGSCMAARLAADGVARDRLEVIPNWADPGVRAVERSANPFRRRHGLGDRFTVLYSGNFGRAHPLDAVLDAAARLEARAPDIQFLLIGEGRGHAAVARAVAERGLANVRLLPYQPAARLADSLGAGDLHLAAMAEAACGLLVPSKVAGALAAGRPCVLLGPPASAPAELLRAHRCGAVLAPDDGDGLARAILAYAGDRHRWREECRNAAAVAAQWGADPAAERFHRLLAEVLRRRARYGAAVRPATAATGEPAQGWPHHG